MTHLKHAGETLEDYYVRGLLREVTRTGNRTRPNQGNHSREEKDHGHDHAESHGYAP